jgi:hypothetical protein
VKKPQAGVDAFTGCSGVVFALYLSTLKDEEKKQ